MRYTYFYLYSIPYFQLSFPFFLKQQKILLDINISVILLIRKFSDRLRYLGYTNKMHCSFLGNFIHGFPFLELEDFRKKFD